VKLIEEISDSGSSLSNTFTENARSYRELSSALEETMTDMGDLRSGGGDISVALTGLKEVSTVVLDGSSSIYGSYREIQDVMTGVTRVSSEVTQSMGGISSLILGISERLKEVERVSMQVGELGERLNADLEYFKTR
jgi:methyl-accepting chemotaxis protein